MKKVHVDDAESRIVRQKRYNTQVYDFVDSLDLGAIVRLTDCLKKTLHRYGVFFEVRRWKS